MSAAQPFLGVMNHVDLVVLTLVSAVACAALVLAESRYRPHAPGFERWSKLRSGSKACASLAFVLLGYLAETWNGNVYDAPAGWPSFTHWMLRGLALGMIGDLALLGHGKQAFLAGLVAFLLGHLAYVIGIAALVPPGDWLGHAGVYAAAPVIIGLAALAYLWRNLGTMKLPVIAYVATIITMVIAAIAVARGAPLPIGNRVLLLVGATLFFASDLAVARDRFYAKAFANKAWGLPAYYAGQLLIAWSLAYQS